jgi:di/tricarboxylate transporter
LRFEKIKGNFGLFAGLALFILILILPPSETFVEYAKLKLSVSEETQDVLKLAYSMKVVFAYANPVIFFFIAGFLIAGAMQKWGEITLKRLFLE